MNSLKIIALMKNIRVLKKEHLEWIFKITQAKNVLVNDCDYFQGPSADSKQVKGLSVVN